MGNVLQKNERFTADGQGCSELYNYESYADNTVLKCSQHPEEELQPILHEEVETAVAALTKGRSAGATHIG